MKGLVRVDCVQTMYNIIARRAEQELFPFCFSEDVGIIVYNPLGGGLLSGKYGKGTQPQGGVVLQ